MEFKQSKTYKNLQTAFEGELKAAARYRLYADKAKKDGYIAISDTLLETSEDEQAHAEIWLKVLLGGTLPDTADNLETASRSEQSEWTTLYRQFADTARDEGYGRLSQLFLAVANIEKRHDRNLQGLLQDIRQSRVFSKPAETVWICLNCGHTQKCCCAPQKCPVCGHPQAFFRTYK